jgi:hypothetical protein
VNRQIQFVLSPTQLDFHLWEDPVSSYRFFRINARAAGNVNYFSEEAPGA